MIHLSYEEKSINIISDSSADDNKLALKGNIFDIYNTIAQEFLFEYDVKSDVITFYGKDSSDLSKSNSISEFLTAVKTLEIISEKDIDDFIPFFKNLFDAPKRKKFEFRSRYFNSDGELSWYSMECRSINNESENSGTVCGRIRNIDDVKETISRVKDAADLDPISKLYNYKAFCEQAEKCIVENSLKKSVLLIAEIDEIRAIESELGCECADAFIRRFGEHMFSLYKNDYIIGHDKYRFLLFSKKERTEENIESDIEGFKGIAKCVVLRGSDDFAYTVNIGKAYYDDKLSNIRNVITAAENDIYSSNNVISSVKSLSHERNNAEVERSTINIMDKLLKFADILFYNFETYDISQTAFGIIADDFDICRVTVKILKGGRLGQEQCLYSSFYEITDETPFTEESIHSITNDIFTYRVYRRNDSVALSPRKERMLKFVFEIIHSSANRFASLQTAKYAQTHDMRYSCLNSKGFMERMDMLEKKINMTDYAVVYMNIQKYKAINSRVGFVKGHKVLKTVVDELNSILKGDEFFGCLGGDNFFAFMRRDTLSENIEKLNNIKCVIEMNEKEVVFTIGFKMGICEIVSKDMTGDIARENASIAFGLTRMPNAPNVVYFTPDKREKYEFQKMLESSLRPALVSGEFLIYLQPKVSLDDYKIVGAEALSRWKKDGKIMPPISFIPYFEQNGMIVEIDFFVFEQVCKLIRSWIDRGIKPIPVSVNFSKVSLETNDFVENIMRISSKYSTPLCYLEIEFTETCCMENEIKFRHLLEKIKECGFKASLDDFGTGFSSINMLKNMNFDVLKLDKSFISDEKSEDEREKIILKSVIKMAKNLELEVISEGVETKEQMNYLKYLKCDQAQGYLFDKPLPIDEFETRLVKESYEI